MLSIIIQNGIYIQNGKVMDVNNCHLGDTIKDTFKYLIRNKIDFSLSKFKEHVQFSPLRLDIERRVMNSLIADNMIHPKKLLS